VTSVHELEGNIKTDTKGLNSPNSLKDLVRSVMKLRVPLKAVISLTVEGLSASQERL
jgi:hypothetical protein